jgi:hypothetical protein
MTLVMAGRAVLYWLDGASCGLSTTAAALLAYDMGMMLICLGWAGATSLVMVLQWAPKVLQCFAVSDCLQCGALWNGHHT